MDRKLILALIGLVAVLGVVNATVFAYRWIQGTINIAPANQAAGAACTGFYFISATNESGSPLPLAGTNYNAQTYGIQTISVTPGDIVCTFSGYNLYESITVTIPVTVGSWYIQDFYGFGYYGSNTDPTVYVYFRVDSTNVSGYLTTAYLIIRNATSGAELGRLDLTKLGNQTTTPITLGPTSPHNGLRLDLYLDAANVVTSTTVSFKVGVYVTQESGEAPSIATSP